MSLGDAGRMVEIKPKSRMPPARRRRCWCTPCVVQHRVGLPGQRRRELEVSTDVGRLAWQQERHPVRSDPEVPVAVGVGDRHRCRLYLQARRRRLPATHGGDSEFAGVASRAVANADLADMNWA